MKRLLGCVVALAALSAGFLPAEARALGVELWTDRGTDGVYQPGEAIQIKTRASDDAYLLIYEIDAEGYIHVLFPYHTHNSFIEGRSTLRIPTDDSRDELVVQGPTGEGYIVAIASRDPFGDLPWYLRAHTSQADDVGYVGRPDDEEGITSEGRIVGDPFVAMERIRRRVLADPEDRESFATAYTEYYVHEQVRYPRYVCYDCHRPGHWEWWDGFDPYYTSCSVFDFRINWGWGWGPTYWFGCQPYYVFVVRDNCPPRYRYQTGTCFSSWDGWKRWSSMWTGRLTRYKSAPPQGYIPPSQYGWENRRPGAMPVRPAPPGFTVAADRGRIGVGRMPVRPVGGGDQRPTPVIQRTDWRPGGELRRGPVERMPARPGGNADTPRGRIERGAQDNRPLPRGGQGEEGSPRVIRPREERPAPQGGGDNQPIYRPRGGAQPVPQGGGNNQTYYRPRGDRGAQSPRVDRPLSAPQGGRTPSRDWQRSDRAPHQERPQQQPRQERSRGESRPARQDRPSQDRPDHPGHPR